MYKPTGIHGKQAA